jgi:long-chain fatty acid transport protein
MPERHRASPAGHPGGGAPPRQSFGVLGSSPSPATVVALMAPQGRFAHAARSSCLSTALGLVLAMGALGPSPIAAQALTSLEFSFSNPGARSLGFGGAFVSLADDATAAYANPAGLVQIARPELSIEGRSWSYSTPYTRGGRAAGAPTGWGIDTVDGPLRSESSAELAGLSFVSLVVPRKGWSFALFRHQLANFEFGLETQGVFGPGSVVAGTARSIPQRSRVDLEILTHGVAVAMRPNDRFSLGLGLTRFEPRMSFLGWDYLWDESTVAAYFSAASFLPERLIQFLDFEAREAAYGLSAGFLWRLSDGWSLGGLYRDTPELAFEVDIVAGPAHPDLPAGSVLADGVRRPWDFPDVWALGLAYRSRDGRWTGAAEWRRVGYSSILESFPPEELEPGEYLNDADEIHLGGEYTFFARSSVVAVRAGVWRDPDHNFGANTDNLFDRAIQVPGEDELHLAAGLGVALRSFQIDFGIDLSERIDTASLSVIYSFGR